jgi:hypothetical protein
MSSETECESALTTGVKKGALTSRKYEASEHRRRPHSNEVKVAGAMDLDWIQNEVLIIYFVVLEIAVANFTVNLEVSACHVKSLSIIHLSFGKNRILAPRNRRTVTKVRLNYISMIKDTQL